MNQNLSTILKKTDSTDPPGASEPHEPDLRARLAAVFPWVLVLGFLGLLGVVLGDRLLPARTLPVTTVVSLEVTDRARQQATADAVAPRIDPYKSPMLFQASGWIEPDPYPTIATTLTNGVLETVRVLEGEAVEKGQVLATLIAEDAELNLDTARHRLAALKAQAAAHDQKIQNIQAQYGTLEKQVEAARARQEQMADTARRLEQMTSRVEPEKEIVQAKLALNAQKAEVAALSAKRRELQAREEQLKREAAEYEARIAEAGTQVDRAQLAYDRTRILSPIDGVISRLMAAPGQKKMLDSENPDSAAIAVLYQPDSLQARIDVPLAEAGKLRIDQPVRLRSNFLPDQEFQGTVTRIVGEADLQRNTLQAKVAIHNPDPRLRPDMLCRAEFLAQPAEAAAPASAKSPVAAAGSPTGAGAGSGRRPSRVRIFVPRQALAERDGTAGVVWKIDDSGNHAQPRPVELGATRRDDHLLVLSGLKPGDRVILDPPADLSPGERVRPAQPQSEAPK